MYGVFLTWELNINKEYLLQTNDTILPSPNQQKRCNCKTNFNIVRYIHAFTTRSLPLDCLGYHMTNFLYWTHLNITHSLRTSKKRSNSFLWYSTIVWLPKLTIKRILLFIMLWKYFICYLCINENISKHFFLRPFLFCQNIFVYFLKFFIKIPEKHSPRNSFKSHSCVYRI